MISAFVNIFKIPELKQRVLFTLWMLVIVRMGAAITTPGVNAHVLHEWFRTAVDPQAGGNVAALFSLFSGGALENCAIFSLGVMPYISASIMIQLLTAVIPRLSKLAREDGGRQKITQYARYATLVLCIFQAYLLSLSFINPETSPFLPGITETIKRTGPLVIFPSAWGFSVITVITLSAGTMFLMWLGDQITERGIGNGMSLIITVGIAAHLPAAMVQAWKTFVPSEAGQASQVTPFLLVVMVLFLVLVIAGVIAITQAQRKISVQYAKRVVGRKVYGGQTQYMPLKVNYAGVMPIIFAQAILLFPSSILGFLFKGQNWAIQLSQMLVGGWLHYTLFGAMIFFFSYFWVATQFQPNQIADDLKKYGGYIPGVRPGKPTADFLDFTMSRLTFAGAIFLTLIAIFPQIVMEAMHVPQVVAGFFGGTSLLILVGVMLDTMRQVETHLIQRHYDGFLRKGKIRGRFERAAYNKGTGISDSSMVWLSTSMAVLIIVAVVILLFVKNN